MTREKAIKMMEAKIKCLECFTSSDCDSCRWNYDQGNIGEQIEWIKLAVEALKESEQVHGQWIERLGRPVCSKCGEEPYRESNRHMPNYCPNCGAKMGEEE